MKTKEMIRVGLFAAVISVLSGWTIPIGTIPVTLGVFAVLLTALILPGREAVFAVFIYLLIGAVGLPVYSGFRGGISVLFGTTGGYLWAYPLMAWMVQGGKKKNTVPTLLLSCVVAGVCCCLMGTVQYALLTEVAMKEAFLICALPFLPVDFLKAGAAVFIGRKIQGRLNR